MAKKTEKEKAPKAKAPNQTLEARFNGKLTKGFTDLRDIVLSVVNQPDDDPKNLHYDIWLTDYKEKFGMKFDNNVYKKIQAEVTRQMRYDTLLSGFDEDGDPMIFFPFQRISWKGNGLIHVVLGEDFKRILVEKGNPMTYYSIAYTLPMKSKYSKVMFPRLFEHIRQNPMEFKSRGDLKGKWFTYYEPVDQFREICGIPESYQTVHLKKVCETILADIEEFTDYKAEVFFNTSQIPTSRKPAITHIAWNLKRKDGDIIDSVATRVPEPNEIPNQIKMEYYALMEEIRSITKNRLDDSSMMAIINNADRHEISNGRLKGICAFAIEKPNVDDLGAYINGIINNGGLPKVAAGSKFNDFEQRNYDFSELEKQLLNK